MPLSPAWNVIASCSLPVSRNREGTPGSRPFYLRQLVRMDAGGRSATGGVANCNRSTAAPHYPELRGDWRVEDQAMTEEALRILASPSPSAYSRALAALRDDTQRWWQQQLGSAPEAYDEDQKPYGADAESLKRARRSRPHCNPLTPRYSTAPSASGSWQWARSHLQRRSAGRRRTA